MINLDNKFVYNHEGQYLPVEKVDLNKGFREHCRFKDAPCNYNGFGWYDRCAWCKDNNGFRDKNLDNNKPF